MKLSKNYSAILIVAILVSFLQATTPNWSIDFEKKIKWQKLTSTGHLVVSTDGGLYGLNPEDGSTAWKMDEIKKLNEEMFELIPYTPYAIVNVGKGLFSVFNKMIVINVADGKEVWNSEQLDINSSMGQFVLPEINALLIYGVNKKGKNKVSVVDIDTGKLIWEDLDFFKKRNAVVFPMTKVKSTIVGNQEPLFDTPETMITFLDNKGLRKHNAKTGELIWDCEIKKTHAPALVRGYSPMFFDAKNKVVYVPSLNKIIAVRTDDGTKVWKKSEKLKGMVQQITLTPQGLLVKTGGGNDGKGGKPSIMLLNTETGKKAWKKEFKKLKSSTNFVVKDDKVLVYSDKKIYSVNLSDGKHEEIAKKIKFKGGESPYGLTLREDGLFLQSSQNLMLLDFNGEKKFHNHFKAPSSSMFAKIASTAAIMAVNAMSVASAYSRAQTNAYNSGGTGTAKYSLINSNPYMSKRFKASKDAANFTYILTDIKNDGEKGPGIAKVNKISGEQEKGIILGTKEPVYEIDEIDGRIFYKSDKKQIQCFKF